MSKTKKLVIIVTSLTLLFALLVVPSSALVMIQGEDTYRYAINPVSNVDLKLYVESANSVDNPGYVDINFTPINQGTSGNFITSGDVTFSGKFPYVSTTFPIDEAYLRYSCTVTSARIFSKLSTVSENTYNNGVIAIPASFTVTWDSFIYDKNYNTEFNLDFEDILAETSATFKSTWWGSVNYPKADGTIGAIPFSISKEKRFTDLTQTPDGNASEQRRVRFFALPTEHYANQNPQTLDYHVIYETAYAQLDDALKPFYVSPEEIEQWEAEENTSYRPSFTRYYAEHSCKVPTTSSNPYLPCMSFQVGSHSMTDNWNDRFERALNTLLDVTNRKRTVDNYDFSRVISNAINSTLNTTLFPGFTIGDVFTIVVGLSLVALLLRLFLGG